MRRPSAALLAVLGVVALLAGCTSSATKGPSATPPASTSRTASGSTSNSDAPLTLRATDWPMYHGRADHDGVSTAMPAVHGTPKVVASIRLDGDVYASPVVIGGMTIVATENDSVYAFDGSYKQLWHQHFGDPSLGTERPCGDIDPLGMTSTPIYSASTGLVYVTAEYGKPVRHQMIALHPRSGTVAWRRTLDYPGATANVMQLRGALAIAGNRVWASFGALTGDCGNYKGRLVGLPLSGSGSATVVDPSTRKQGGIWNPAGPTVDARGHLLAVSANGSSFPGDAYDRTNSVLDVDPATGKIVDTFAPTDWAQNNQADLGLGSNGVALVGSKWAVLGGKSGPVYVLRQGHLGGIGGQVDVQTICKAYGGSAVRGDVVYLPCADRGLIAVRVDSAGKLHVVWRASGRINGSPVLGGGKLWALDPMGGSLHELDPATGKPLDRVLVGVTSRFATPAIAGRDILVPTLAGLTVVRTS